MYNHSLCWHSERQIIWTHPSTLFKRQILHDSNWLAKEYSRFSRDHIYRVVQKSCYRKTIEYFCYGSSKRANSYTSSSHSISIKKRLERTFLSTTINFNNFEACYLRYLSIFKRDKDSKFQIDERRVSREFNHISNSSFLRWKQILFYFSLCISKSKFLSYIRFQKI